MNRIHRHGGRIASGRSSRSRHAAYALIFLTIAAGSLLSPLPARAAPDGGVIKAGTGSIAQQGNTTIITQTTAQQPARMIIDWNGFSSTAGESIVFQQPNAAAIALNRITGASPSQLLGSLTANGQVFILNPNGIFFGAGAQVNVRGLLASTLDIDNTAFLGGINMLQPPSSGKIVNQGMLKASDGGYVALVAERVTNDAFISARKGDVLLASGNKVTLRIDGGSLLGYSVDVGTAAALIENTPRGFISASGGRVVLESRAEDALSKAAVNQLGVIEAQTLEGSAGSIRLVGDRIVGDVLLTGTLDASAPGGGDGGAISISGARVNIADSARISMAAGGQPGALAIGANDVDIIAPQAALPEGTGSSISAPALAAALGTGNVSVISTADTARASPGDLNVNGEVAWFGNRLVLQADQNINLNASMKGNKLILNYGQASAEGGGADYNLNNGAKVDLYPSIDDANGFFMTQKGSNRANLRHYDIISSLGPDTSSPSPGNLQGALPTTATGYYVLGTDIDASATKGWDGNAGFRPLGQLNGVFDGLGHKITDLTINRPSNSTQGLFTSLGAGAAVRNLGMTNVSISGGDAVGAVAGNSAGTIRNVYVTGKISGRRQAGGLVGINAGSLANVYSRAAVAGTEIIGGLVGANTGGIRDSYAQGSVNGQSSVGGLVGASASGSTLQNSYATGAVTGADAATTHGLVGTATAGTVSDSYWNSDSIADGGTGQKAPGVGEGRTGAQMRQAATFSNWNLAATGGAGKVWRIYEGDGMPLLRSFLAPLALAPASTVEYSGKVQKNPDVPTEAGRSGTAASGRDAGTYRPVSDQQGYDISNGELVITPKPLDIGASIGTKVYDGTTTATATFTDNRVADDNFTIDHTSADFDNKNVGNGKNVSVGGIRLAGKDAANYRYRSAVDAKGNITPRGLALTFSAADKDYDGTTTAAASVSGNQIRTDDLSIKATARFDDRNAGVGKTVRVTGLQLGGADAGNYTYIQPGTTTAGIRPRLLELSATAADKVYDGTASAVAVVKDNRIAGDALVIDQVARFSDKNASEGKKVTVSGIAVTGADAANYRYAAQTLQATAGIARRALAITATAADKAYDGTTRASAALADNRLAGDAVNPTFASAGFVDKNAGRLKTVTVSGIALDGADAGNYQANASATASASISPLGLVISANPDVRNAGGPPYQGGNGVSYAGFLPGETAAVLGGRLQYGGTAQGAVRQGSYRITPGGLSSVNYALTFVDGMLTLQPAPPVPVTPPAPSAPSLPTALSNASLAAAEIHRTMPLPAAHAGRADPLRVTDCGLRMPENMLTGGCQSDEQPSE